MVNVSLIRLRGPDDATVVPVTSTRFIIGRREECHLCLETAYVSRLHCIILVREGQVSVADLGSTNGTFVGGERVEGKRRLKSGDVIRLGPVKLEVLIEGSRDDSGVCQSSEVEKSTNQPSTFDAELRIATDCPGHH